MISKEVRVVTESLERHTLKAVSKIKLTSIENLFSLPRGIITEHPLLI